MPSRGKKKTTMAKLNRESRLRERKAEKEARKEARRHAAMFGPPEELGGVESQDDDGGPSAEVDGSHSPEVDAASHAAENAQTQSRP